jgi:hypothetical protein
LLRVVRLQEAPEKRWDYTHRVRWSIYNIYPGEPEATPSLSAAISRSGKNAEDNSQPTAAPKLRNEPGNGKCDDRNLV